MSKLAIFVIFMIICIQLSLGGVFSRTNNGISKNFVGKRNSFMLENAQSTVQSKEENTLKSFRQSGPTAWGLILIIIAIIILGFAGYYGFLCYPLLCKREKNYQFMDGSSSTTSKSIQSIENFPVESNDRKH